MPDRIERDLVHTAVLPFACPACGAPFGFGAAAELLTVVSSLPVIDEPTPCCGARLDGTLERVGDSAVLRLTRYRVPSRRT